MRKFIAIVLTFVCSWPVAASQNLYHTLNSLDNRFAASEHPDHPEGPLCKVLRPAAGTITGAAIPALMFLPQAIVHGGWKATKKELPWVALAGGIGGLVGSVTQDALRDTLGEKKALRVSAIAGGLAAGYAVAIPVMRLSNNPQQIRWAFPLFAFVGAMSGIIGGVTADTLKSGLH